MKRLSKIFSLAVCTLSLYVAVSYGVYRVKHPEMTETQLFMNVRDALLWKE